MNRQQTTFTVTTYEHNLKKLPELSSQFKRDKLVRVSAFGESVYKVKAEHTDINTAYDLYEKLRHQGVPVFKNFIT